MGSTRWISKPLITPGETRTRCTGAGLGLNKAGAEARLEVEPMIPPITPSNCPPGIPPGTPPTTPPVIVGGGTSSSLIIWTFAGILLGARSRPYAMLLATFTTLGRDAVDAAGGGGGGGGGGTISKVTNCSLGSTSVNHNGSKSKKPITRHCKINEKTVDHVLLLRPTVESSKLSSNRAFSRAAEARGLIVTGTQDSIGLLIGFDLST